MDALPAMRCGLLVLMLATTATPARAQSETPSEASAVSVSPSVEAAAVTLSLLPAGSELVVQSLRPVGKSVELVLVASATGTSVALHVAADTVRALGLSAGTTLVLAAVSGGFVLSAGAEIVAFVPDALTRSLIHDAELHR